MNEEQFKQLEAAVLSKKLKLLKDAIKEVSLDAAIPAEDYKKLALIASELGANPILTHIFSLIEKDEDILSKCFLIAVKNNKQKTMEYCLELETNIDINLVDDTGNTALHYAIFMKKSKIIETLINKGADLNIENKEKLVPLALAWKLDSSPAILDLLINTQKTDMKGEAGLKVMKEAFSISKGRKKEQRRNMKADYFSNVVSKMSKEEFIKKHGEIKNVSTNIGGLHTPNDGAELIMKGSFTNIGYFTREQDYKNMKHNWEAIDYAINFTNKIAKILNDANCFAPNTEGSNYYEPFFIPEAGWSDLISFDSKPSSEALEASSGAYNKWPSSYSNYGNVFINDIKEHFEDDFIDEKQYKAFIEASKLMEENLVDTYNIQLYPDFVEFPWLFLGIDKYRNLVGVATTAVWT
jgi:ankyrin repeat protein